MFNFKKKQIKNENICEHLTVSNDCKAISELRQLQRELEEIENEIKKLNNIKEVDLTEFNKFFLSRELDYIDRQSFAWSKLKHLSGNDIRCIQSALYHIDDFDKFINEMWIMYDNENIIAEKQAKAVELRNNITEVKNKLGIK